MVINSSHVFDFSIEEISREIMGSQKFENNFGPISRLDSHFLSHYSVGCCQEKAFSSIFYVTAFYAIKFARYIWVLVWQATKWDDILSAVASVIMKYS